MMNSFAYFPGCSLHSTAKEYDLSIKQVSASLGIELLEIADWNCCGAASAGSLNTELELALNGRNLQLAEKLHLDIAVPCSICYRKLAGTNHLLRQDQETNRRISQILEEKLTFDHEVKPLLEIFTSAKVLQKLQREAVKSLSGLRVVAYYGCLWKRPPKPEFDNFENPSSMDKLVTLMGGEALPWPYKTECCGHNLAVTEPDTSLRLIERLLNMAKECGADCIITACPTCQINLDLGQKEISKRNGHNYELPILYFTQLMGLVLGLSYKNLGLSKHFIDPRGVLQRVGLT